MDGTASNFASEVERVRESGLVGRSGRLRELFDFLAARGPDGAPASQSEIAETVVGRSAESDDATARVYVHRLRKRLEQFYHNRAAGDARLVLPAGSYALRFNDGGDDTIAPPTLRARRWLVPVLLVLALAAAFVAGRELHSGTIDPPVNAIWQPFLDSDRPIMIAAGDYYIYGQFDHNHPEVNRLVRDFSINSKTDLARAQEADPARYGDTEDMGLDYLPVSSAYALRALIPVLARGGKRITVMPASQIDSDIFRTYNVIYVGLISGMGMLDDVAFTDSNFAVGESYDELVDMDTGRHYVSGETFALPTPQFYKDYGYVARFREPGGALVGILAGERDTGLRGVAPLAVAAKLPREIEQRAGGEKAFEALYQITGQQGADLGEQVVEARARP